METAAAAVLDQELSFSSGDRRLYLQKFRLYETQSQFYMIGRDKGRTMWRLLKIDRTKSSELDFFEDPTMYTENECWELLQRIHEGNRSSGGLIFVTICYGIVGFVRFLGPYYMLVITKRRKIGTICGHTVYEVSKSKMIAIPNSSVQSRVAHSKNENRYKKLLCMVDLTKDFFFSYSYHIMHSLQRNIRGETEQVPYETMSVWNEYLTRGIRTYLKNTIWTVALVHGFFKQDKVSISGKDFSLILIARRSRHFAGTRYLKRGVNEKGRVANDVETEQIVFEDVPGGIPTQISSVVQNRGSIPLSWSQESSWLNVKPDIILHMDQNYEATRLHFDNLVKRYGNPIIILNLIKAREKKPRESILYAEFARAIDYINKNLSEDAHLRLLHLDLNKHSRRKGTHVLRLLGKVAAYALDLTGFFYCQVPPELRVHDALSWPLLVKDNAGQWSFKDYRGKTNDVVGSGCGSCNDNVKSSDSSPSGYPADDNYSTTPPTFQNGVLRTNCIDCLDRTNVAQYAYGLAALGHQLYALGFIDVKEIDLDASLADELLHSYERMGDTLALQYGGSAAHNKIFSERRGQWKAATQSQELLRIIQRYYSNTYIDAERQDAINVFLGYFQPHQAKPALWELDSDQHYNIGRRGHTIANENMRSSIKRSLSDGYILCESSTPVPLLNVGEIRPHNSALPANWHIPENVTNSTTEISTCESDMSYVSFNPTTSCTTLGESEHGYSNKIRFDVSNLLDFDWISSSGNSCEDENYERSSLINSPVETLSTENVSIGMTAETTTNLCENSIKGIETGESEMPFNATKVANICGLFESFKVLFRQ